MSETRVYTNYGTYAHKPSREPKTPYELRQRMYTDCTGTSAWTQPEWASTEDHPRHTAAELLDLPDCPRCFKERKG